MRCLCCCSKSDQNHGGGKAAIKESEEGDGESRSSEETNGARKAEKHQIESEAVRVNSDRQRYRINKWEEGYRRRKAVRMTDLQQVTTMRTERERRRKQSGGSTGKIEDKRAGQATRLRYCRKGGELYSIFN